MMSHLINVILLVLIFMPSSHVFATKLTKEIVLSEGHTMTVWHKQNVQNKAEKGVILLLHGRTWSALPDFDLQLAGEQLSVMDHLVDLGFDVWALDARGYGATPRDATGWNNPDKAANDVANIIKWLSHKTAQKPVLFGWSYGSMTAQLMVQKHPELTKAVILYGYPIDPEKVIVKTPEFVKPLKAKNTAKNAASDFIVEGSISQQAIAAYVTASLQADPIRADWNFTEQWNQLSADKVKVPLLLIQAEHDPLADTEAHARFFSKLPNANKQWIVLAGGDHAALLETPKFKLVQSVSDFVTWLDK
ncbi:MAG: pimeloyl-ACP methyl ester carboxylesterase [Alteromonadaceae bacterium]|jgi:pimeloyl-ACP methyl ester carboxylesterase